MSNLELVANEFLKRGVRPEVAAGAIAGIMGESGQALNPLSFNPRDPGGGSGGIGQWNRDRLVGANGMLAFARAHGIDVDVNTPTDSRKVPIAIQAAYLGHELDTRYNSVLKGLQVLHSGEEGLNLWVDNYEVPLDKAGAKAQRRGYINPVTSLLGGRTEPFDVAGGAGGGSATTSSAPAPPPLTPQPPSLGSILGEALSGGSFAPSAPFADPVETPNAPSLASQTNFTPAHDPVPAAISQGGGMGSQLGMLAAQAPAGALLNPSVSSITQGAPGMTTMLGDIGDPNPVNYQDTRRTGAPSPFSRLARLT